MDSVRMERADVRSAESSNPAPQAAPAPEKSGWDSPAHTNTVQFNTAMANNPYTQVEANPDKAVDRFYIQSGVADPSQNPQAAGVTENWGSGLPGGWAAQLPIDDDALNPRERNRVQRYQGGGQRRRREDEETGWDRVKPVKKTKK
jgi:hypothetical protein